MSRLGASKLALSSISSEEIWARSGRLNAAGSELFHFSDRKDVGYILSPTHEEEITTLVSNTVKSYRELPVRLYQISRKYRDELRPRHGLLRSREFIMKDLYTFDHNATLALETYHKVREVYASIFDELKLPYLVAEADSGDMGGDLSHEFHFPTSRGEDHIISCRNCGYVANEELSRSNCSSESQEIVSENSGMDLKLSEVRVWRGVSRDRQTLVNVWYLPTPSSNSKDTSSDSEINIHAVKAILPDLDASIEDCLPFWVNQRILSTEPREGSLIPRRLINLVDNQLPESFVTALKPQNSNLAIWPPGLDDMESDIEISILTRDPSTQQRLSLLRIKHGDPCPRCSTGIISIQKAIELGHTFHLGTRYTQPLNATITIPVKQMQRGQEAGGTTKQVIASQKVFMQMGCHGIGVSRMIGAVADTLADEKGLNWPRVISPFEVIVIPGKGLEIAGLEVYDKISSPAPSSGHAALDLVLDDRPEALPWKLRDADLIGYPVIIIVGKRWKAEKICEVQCRRLKTREEVSLEDLTSFVNALLAQL
ncbi:hypothetical protein B7494_g2677 [Chlorociboria aeruginascens]|nr:hypothetical protein B7494_g2677 [Chlorociboria aeruginascens]